jgi:hypothetical protein
VKGIKRTDTIGLKGVFDGHEVGDVNKLLTGQETRRCARGEQKAGAHTGGGEGYKVYYSREPK